MLLTENTFEDLIFDVNARLVNFAGRLVGDRACASDIVQDSYISLWNQYGHKMVWRPESLLYTIVRNKCLDFLKTMSLFRNISIDAIPEFRQTEELAGMDLTGDTGDIPLICNDLKKCVEETVASLPPRCREVFRLSRFERLTNKEIARRLGISEKAVEKHITKALKIISTGLTGAGFNPVKILVLLFI